MFPLSSIPITNAPVRPFVPRSILKKTSRVIPGGVTFDLEPQQDAQVSPSIASPSVVTSSIVTSSIVTSSIVSTPKSCHRRPFSELKQMPLFPWSKRTKLVRQDLLSGHVVEQPKTSPRVANPCFSLSTGPIRTTGSRKRAISPKNPSVAEVARGLRFRSLPYKRAVPKDKKKVEILTFENLGAFCKDENMDTEQCSSYSYEVMEVDESATDMDVDCSINYDQTMEA